MDKMSLVSILFVSFPEELLIVATTMAFAGYKDLLNFRRKENILKLLLSSALMVAAAVTLRSVLPSVTFSALLVIPLYFIIIILVYRYKPVTCIPGFVLSMIILFFADALFVSLFLKVMNLSLEQYLKSDLLKILSSLPKDSVLVLVLVFISYKKNIRLRFKKLSISRLVQLALFALLFVQSMFSAEKVWKSVSRAYNSTFILLINIFIVLFFLLWLFFYIFKLEEKSEINKKLNNFELERIKKLLKEGQSSHAVKLIDLTLKQRGQENDEAQNF